MTHVNDTTRKYPRSLQEAFGPSTSTEFREERPGYGTTWWIAMGVVSLLAAIVIGATL